MPIPRPSLKQLGALAANIGAPVAGGVGSAYADRQYAGGDLAENIGAGIGGALFFSPSLHMSAFQKGKTRYFDDMNKARAAISGSNLGAAEMQAELAKLTPNAFSAWSHGAEGFGMSAVKTMAAKAGLIAAPRALSSFGNTMQNISDATSNVNKFTGDIANPENAYTFRSPNPKGGPTIEQPLNAEQHKKLLSMLPKKAPAPKQELNYKFLVDQLKSGKGKIENTPSTGKEIQQGLRGLARFGSEGAPNLTDATKDVKGFAGAASSGANAMQGLTKTLQNLAVDPRTRKLIDSQSALNESLTRYAPALLTGGLAVGGIYGLAKLIESLRARKRKPNDRLSYAG